MSISSINSNNYVQSYETQAKADTTSKDKTTEKTVSEDTYETGKSTSFDRTEAKKAIDAAEQAKAESLQKLLSSMLQTQYSKYVQSMPSENLGAYFSNIEVDEATRLQAQKDVSEDGYWGVEKTAGRILDFAKALAGDDLDKLNTMKDAVKKGFKIAEDLWGGELPEISGKTYDRVMEGFDEWEKSITEKQSGVTQPIN